MFENKTGTQLCYINSTYLDDNNYIKFAELIISDYMSLEYKYKLVKLDKLEEIIKEAQDKKIVLDFKIEEGFLKCPSVQSIKGTQEELHTLESFVSRNPETKVKPLKNSIYTLMNELVNCGAYYINMNTRDKANLKWNDNRSIGLTDFKNVKFAENTMSCYVSFINQDNQWTSRKIIEIDDSESLQVRDFNFVVPIECKSKFINEEGITLLDTGMMFEKQFCLFKCEGDYKLSACYDTVNQPYSLLNKYAYMSKVYKTIYEVLSSFRSEYYKMQSLGEEPTGYSKSSSATTTPKVGVFIRTNYTKPTRYEIQNVWKIVLKETAPYITKNNIQGAVDYINRQPWDAGLKVGARILLAILVKSNRQWGTIIDLLNDTISDLLSNIYKYDAFLYAHRASAYLDYYSRNCNVDRPIFTEKFEITGSDAPYNSIYERRLR